MTTLERSLGRISRDLGDLDLRFALVGGLAVSARAEPRLTRYADLAVAVASDEEAERLIAQLRPRGYRVEAIVEHEPTGRLATVRLLPDDPDQPAIVDLLFASCGIEPEIAAGADLLAILPDLELPVASIGHLIAMKLLARDDRRRPADADDLRALDEIATDADWSTAQAAVELVTSRGCNQGRDLIGSLARLRTHGPY